MSTPTQPPPSVFTFWEVPSKNYFKSSIVPLSILAQPEDRLQSDGQGYLAELVSAKDNVRTYFHTTKG
jgi:hypothetical protein